jgi:ribosomal protein L14E/L6E/L27E
MKPRFALECGRVVYSTAGRDAGRRFIIVDAKDGNYVTYADGDLRKLASPKKKKMLHVRPTEEYFPSIAEKIKNGLAMDSDIRKLLMQCASTPAVDNEERNPSDDGLMVCKEG